MAMGLFTNSYDRHTIAATTYRFADGCDAIVSGVKEPFALIRSPYDDHHGHHVEMDWSTLAWNYVDKGKPFPNG